MNTCFRRISSLGNSPQVVFCLMLAAIIPGLLQDIYVVSVYYRKLTCQNFKIVNVNCNAKNSGTSANAIDHP